MINCLPEDLKIVKLFHGAANGIASDVITCKNAVGPIWFVIWHYGAGGDTDLVLSLVESTDVAAGTSAAVTAEVPIWADTDAGTSSDVLVRQTDAASYTIDTGAGADAMVVIQWDPALHTDGYDCIALGDSGGDASNTCTVLAMYEPRYKGQTLDAAITD